MARKADSELRSGRDPAAPKYDGDTFEQLCRAYVEKHVMPNTRPKSGREIARILGLKPYPNGELALTGVGIIAAWEGRLAASITGRDVISLIDTIAARGAPVSANRTLTVLKSLFSWAISRQLLTSSPCDGIRPPAKERPRQRVLRPEELKAVWRASERLGWPAGSAYQLLILSGQRKSQVAHARLEDFDMKERVWTIPGTSEGSKSGLPHVLPITREIEDIVKACPHSHGYVFSQDGAEPLKVGTQLKAKLDKLIAAEGAAVEPWTTHDLRRTMRSEISALAVPEGDIVREMVIGHVRPGVSGIYDLHRYLPEKRICLERWAERVRAIVEAPEPGGNIVQIGAREAASNY